MKPERRARKTPGLLRQWELGFSGEKNGVTDGTRTRNNQNHNLALYH